MAERPRKSKPWAVVAATPGGPIRTEHRSQPEAYRRVNSLRGDIEAGRSRVSRIRVEQWDRDGARWVNYENAYPA